jgi:hypothetical protein
MATEHEEDRVREYYLYLAEYADGMAAAEAAAEKAATVPLARDAERCEPGASALQRNGKRKRVKVEDSVQPERGVKRKGVTKRARKGTSTR